jgi:hypothetical protein
MGTIWFSAGHGNKRAPINMDPQLGLLPPVTELQANLYWIQNTYLENVGEWYHFQNMWGSTDGALGT